MEERGRVGWIRYYWLACEESDARQGGEAAGTGYTPQPRAKWCAVRADERSLAESVVESRATNGFGADQCGPKSAEFPVRSQSKVPGASAGLVD